MRHHGWSAMTLCAAIQVSPAADVSGDFSTALVAASRSPDITAAEDVYASLLGAWEVETRDRTEDGHYQVGHGEWFFARTLEGRAVQDVWIAPARGQRRSEDPRFANRYGTSVRTFDPASRRWQVTWLNPVTGAFDVLHTRVDGTRIVQEGARASGQRMRWIFQEITAKSFHWTGEAQQPDGSWRLEAEFFGHRQR